VEPGADILPATPDRVWLLGVALLGGSYRAGRRYLARYQEYHVRERCTWGKELDFAVEDVQAALLRGRGPDKKAPEVLLEQEAYMPRDPEEHGGRSPRHVASPRRAWLAARGALLRAVEVTGISLHARSVEVVPASDTKPLVIRLGLPVSKCDVAGVGRVRPLTCVCGEQLGVAKVEGAEVCAACAVKEELDRRVSLVRSENPTLDPGREGPEWQQLPLFTTVAGGQVKEAALIGAWRALCAAAAQAGAPTPPGSDPNWQKPTGHSARRSGAKLLARLGWALWMIQWFGRWASDAVKGYVEEVWTELAGHWGFGSPGSAVEPPPASGTPSTVAAPAAQVKAGPAPPADGAQARLEWGEVRSRLEALASVDGRLQDLDQAFARMQARLAKWEAGGEPGGKDGNEEARVEAADDGLPVELAEAAVPAQLAALREEVQRLADAIAKEREERAALEDQMPQEALQLGARG